MDNQVFISPSFIFDWEGELINALLSQHDTRYHIFKDHPTEQNIAEILEMISPKYLGRITLHSHFHLVLAYGVGGIHYTQHHLEHIGKLEAQSKIQLYQGFGTQVSADANKIDPHLKLDYLISGQIRMPSDATRTCLILDRFIEKSQTRDDISSILEKIADL